MSSSTTRHWKCDRCGLVKDQPGNAIGMPQGWTVFRFGQGPERQLCEACTAALSRYLLHKTNEDRYRAALQAIVDYDPAPPILALHNRDCEECRRLRALPFPALCSRHHQQWLAWRDECAVVDAALHHELRAIARKALEEPEP